MVLPVTLPTVLLFLASRSLMSLVLLPMTVWITTFSVVAIAALTFPSLGFLSLEVVRLAAATTLQAAALKLRSRDLRLRGKPVLPNVFIYMDLYCIGAVERRILYTKIWFFNFGLLVFLRT